MGECYSPLWALVVTAPDLFLWDLGELELQAGAVLSSCLPHLTSVPVIPPARQACVAEALPPGHPDM